MEIFIADRMDSPTLCYASGRLPCTWRRQGIQIQETNQPKENTITTVHTPGLGGGREEEKNN